MSKYLLFLTAFFTAACHAEPALPIQEPQTVNEQPATAARLSINGQYFDLALENNPTAQAFAGLLPLELNMQDHLNNEKFAALPKVLPADDKRAGRIEAGDVMLYQGGTLVVFYDSFDSSYRYTKIGIISRTDGLKNALGRGNARVRIYKTAP